jgi:hypothetical protein
MKKTLIVLGMAVALPLLAADTNTTANAVAMAPVSLVEQATLVREIAADASRDFDAEAHAKWIRQQIDALREPSGSVAPAITNSIRHVPPFASNSTTNAPVSLAMPRKVNTANTVNTSASEELQQVIDRLRILKLGLETRPKSE